MDETLKKELATMLDDFKKGLPTSMTAEEVSKAVDVKMKEFETNFAEKGVSKEDFQKLEKAMKEQGEFLAKIETKGFGTKMTIKEAISNAIAEKAEDIKGVVKGGVVEIDVTKALGTVTTASGTVVSEPAITGVQQAPLGAMNLRDVVVDNYVTSLSTSLQAYPYTEATPKDGDYAFLAEGGTKTQVDLQWTTRYAQPVKVAAWIKLTEESVQDVAGLQSLASDFLYKKHQIARFKGILFGNGTSPNPKGATTYGRAFVSGSMAHKLETVTFMDVVNACITDIGTTHNYTDEMPYMANLVMVNPIDFFLNIVSAKTTEGVPLYPTASLFNMVVIGGVTIVPEENITAGKIFVADLSKYNVTNYMPYTVKIGWVNDDFIKNQFVMLGESRFHAFVKKLDEQAFIYDTIATIETALLPL